MPEQINKKRNGSASGVCSHRTSLSKTLFYFTIFPQIPVCLKFFFIIICLRVCVCVRSHLKRIYKYIYSDVDWTKFDNMYSRNSYIEKTLAFKRKLCTKKAAAAAAAALCKMGIRISHSAFTGHQ